MHTTVLNNLVLRTRQILVYRMNKVKEIFILFVSETGLKFKISKGMKNNDHVMMEYQLITSVFFILNIWHSTYIHMVMLVNH